MHLPIQINEQSAEPLYSQIEVQLRSLIVSGRLKEGTLLPSNRELAQLLKCSVITIRRVYQDLESEGLLRTRQGTGTFVAEVNAKDRDRHRIEGIVEAFQTAVETGYRLQSTEDEMSAIFQRVLRERQGGQPG